MLSLWKDNTFFCVLSEVLNKCQLQNLNKTRQGCYSVDSHVVPLAFGDNNEWKISECEFRSFHSTLNPLSANPTKWPNTLKTIRRLLSTNRLSVFDHFVGLALEGLSCLSQVSIQQISLGTTFFSPLCNALKNVMKVLRWSSFAKIINAKSRSVFAKTFHREIFITFLSHFKVMWKKLGLAFLTLEILYLSPETSRSMSKFLLISELLDIAYSLQIFWDISLLYFKFSKLKMFSGDMIIYVTLRHLTRQYPQYILTKIKN